MADELVKRIPWVQADVPPVSYGDREELHRKMIVDYLADMGRLVETAEIIPWGEQMVRADSPHTFTSPDTWEQIQTFGTVVRDNYEAWDATDDEWDMALSDRTPKKAKLEAQFHFANGSANAQFCAIGFGLNGSNPEASGINLRPLVSGQIDGNSGIRVLHMQISSPWFEVDGSEAFSVWGLVASSANVSIVGDEETWFSCALVG